MCLPGARTAKIGRRARVVRWQYILGTLTPQRNGTSILGRFTKEETKEHVYAAEDKKEESGDKGEVIHMLREDCSSDTKKVSAVYETA